MTKRAKKETDVAADGGAKAAAAQLRMLPQRYEPSYPVKKLKRFPGNPKEHDLGAIAESMRANGFAGAVIVQKSTGRIIAGHGTAETAEQEGGKAVPAIVVDCDDATAKRLLLAFNRVPQLGGFRDDLLAQMLAAIAKDDGAAALMGTGYDVDDVERLARHLSAPSEFPAVSDDTIPTEYCCPRCRYEWSGSPKPAAQKK